MKHSFEQIRFPEFNRTFRYYICIISAICVSLCTGCKFEENAAIKNVSDESVPWTITELRADRGHDTMESDDGGMYHNYFCAVVLTRNDESLSLLYENRLPEHFELDVGDQCHVHGLSDATYSEHWHGYWLHTVQLEPVDPD